MISSNEIPFTAEALESIKEQTKAKDVFIMRVSPNDRSPHMTRSLVFDFGKKTRRFEVPQYFENIASVHDWVDECIDSLAPKKPRPGAAKRKTQPSIKSKVTKSLSELALNLSREMTYRVIRPRRYV